MKKLIYTLVCLLMVSGCYFVDGTVKVTLPTCDCAGKCECNKCRCVKCTCVVVKKVE
jgi:hypothetical protein